MFSSLSDLPTPSLIVEKSRLEANIASMQARANTEKVRLRPHIKTHKSIRIAELQRDAGAHGITVAKVSEAEVFVDAGFEDVRIAYPVVGSYQLDQITKLSKRAKISFGVDTLEGAKIVDAFFASRGQKAEVLIEVNTGSGRCGVQWDDEESLLLPEYICASDSLHLCGVMTHAGNSYGGPKDQSESKKQAMIRSMEAERDHLIHFATLVVDRCGLDSENFELSVGSTPTASVFANQKSEGLRITEIRPGTYVFQDMLQVGIGSAKMPECALTVLTRLVSQHREADGTERLFIDAGKKVFTSDRGKESDGYGAVLHSARTMTKLPHLKVANFSEEHGWLEVNGGSSISVGDTMRIVPEHVCVVVNTQDQMFLVDGETIIEPLKIDARGKVW